MPITAQAQGNYVYVNNQDVSNSVSAYSVSPAGVLTQIAGSPFLTGGRGANVNCYGLDRIVVSAPNHVLFVTNTLDLTISAFQINPATGSLANVPGSPFASGLSLDACQGISLAATPDGKFLMASSNGQIQTFNIAANGVLSLAATTPNCCSPMVGMKISPNGQLLAISNETSASVFTIDPATGSLTPVLGSPFPRTGTGTLASLDFNSCGSNLLFGGEATSISNAVDAWDVATAGILSPVPGSPFHAASGTNSNVVLLSPDNAHLFESNQLSSSINSFNLKADGSLTSVGSFGGAGFLHTPAGMATDQSGNFLYVADDPFGIAVLRINGDGSLLNVSDTAIARPGEIQGVAAYPPRSCASADLAVTITAAPDPVVVLTNVTYSITVTNNGPSAAGVTIEDVLPAGKLFFVSCSATGGGVCSGSANNRFVSFPSLLSGQSATATIVAQVSSSLANNSTLSNTVLISSSSAVDPDPTNNSATATVNVATLTPTILSVAPANGTFGGNAILSATLKKSIDSSPVVGKSITFQLNGASAGSAITDATGTASVTASVATLAAGKYPAAVQASFAGDTVFAASSGTGDLIVGPAVLTVTANNASRIYGDPNPTFTYTISGFLNGDTASVVSGAPSCTSAPATANVGAYPITCTVGTLAAANYSFVFVDGTLTVTPAALSVTAANASRVYGDANPAFNGTITGIKNGDNITAAYSSNATPASPVGTYAIVPALVDPTGKLANYVVTATNGTLTVTPAPLSVTAANATRAFGAPNPPFTGIITGIKNGDNIAATYSTPATPASPVGTYPIIPSLVDPAGKLSNYSVTLNNGTLTITGAQLIVTADNASRVYGDPNPTFTGTITGLQNGDVITATYSTVADITSPVGSYAIVPTLVGPAGELANYSVVINNGVLTITKAPLTLTADNATRAYGDPNPAFSGTITGLKNGDNITESFSSAPPTANVGAYPIVPSPVDPTGKAGNYSINAVNGTLTITPVPLSVTADNATRLYGDANPAFTGTITGLKNGDNITASYSTSATPASAIGAYPITPALVDPTGKLVNYTVTALTNGVLTVTPAPLNAAAANATRFYGDLNPVLTGTITGLKNNDDITATYSTAATPASPVGTYPIVPAVADPTGKLPNYTLTSTNGTLTVTASALTVTAANATRLYGDANPAFTGTITGLKNGDTITATFSSAADPTSAVGSYAIVPTLVDPAGKLANYTVISNNGIFTVTPAPLTAAAANATRLYGDPNPVFAGTITGLKNGDNITATFSSAATAASSVGTYPIVPSFVDPAGRLSNYTVVSSGTLTVTPAPLTASADNASRLYGDPNPTFTGALAGLKNGDNITESFTSAGPTSPVGIYPIVPALVDPTGKSGNYTVTFSNGTLTITPAPLSVAAANATRLYGDPNPVFTGTIIGLKNSDNITASFATTATPASAVGTFAIVTSLIDPTAKLGNYTVTSSNGTLTVTPAPLTVAAANASRTYGSANPAFTGSITGLKNGDNITATFSTTATASSPAGAYAIIPTLIDPTAKLGNYGVTSINGTLTIDPAPLTITANPQTLILGSTTVAASATYSGFVLGQTPANLTGTLTCTAVNGTAAVGTFAPPNGIACSGQSSPNYAITFVQGVKTVDYEPSGHACTNGPGHVILAPISPAGTTIFGAATRNIAVQFRVCGVNGASVGTAGVISSFKLVSVNGVAATTPAPLGGPFTFVPGLLAGGAGSAGWQFNLSTSNLTHKRTYGYQISLNDGTVINFQFHFN